MIKALFFDLDGTLLSTQKTILSSTRTALKKCQEKGIKVFFATARSPMLDKMLGWSAGEFSLFNGGIYCNGACEKIGQQVEYAFLNPDVVRYCVKQVSMYDNVHIALHLENEIHAFNHILPDSALVPWGLTREKITEITDPCCSRTVKILIYHDNLIDTSTQLPEELFCKLTKYCEDKANIYLTDHGKTIQVVKKNTSKYASIEKVRKTLGLTQDEVAVFGDDLNDIEMLSNYKNSVAMGNAVNQVKMISCFTTKSNDNNGIAFALEHLLSVC